MPRKLQLRILMEGDQGGAMRVSDYSVSGDPYRCDHLTN